MDERISGKPYHTTSPLTWGGNEKIMTNRKNACFNILKTINDIIDRDYPLLVDNRVIILFKLYHTLRGIPLRDRYSKHRYNVLKNLEYAMKQEGIRYKDFYRGGIGPIL